eukprot:1419130-Amphidinium_carterae.1
MLTWCGVVQLLRTLTISVVHGIYCRAGCWNDNIRINCTLLGVVFASFGSFVLMGWENKVHITTTDLNKLLVVVVLFVVVLVLFVLVVVA